MRAKRTYASRKAYLAAYYRAHRKEILARKAALRPAFKPITSAYRRAYNRLWMRKARLLAGTYQKPHKGISGHAWTQEMKDRMKLTVWMKRFNPDLMYLLA